MLSLSIISILALATASLPCSAVSIPAERRHDASSSPSSVLRKRDHALECSAQLPPQSAFPLYWDREDFADTTDLCSLWHTGCACVNGRLNCRGEADYLPELNQAFRAFCRNNCFCLDIAIDNKENIDPDPEAQPVHPNIPVAAAANPHRMPLPVSDPLDWAAVEDAPTWTEAASAPRTWRRPQSCGGRICWNARSCGAGGKSCGCTVDLSGTVGRYRAACGISLFPRSLGDGPDLQARNETEARIQEGAVLDNSTTFNSNQTQLPFALPKDVPVACPCNCTYVSTACCTPEAAAANGMVQEHPSKNLGTILPPDGTCCNAKTGELENLIDLGNSTGHGIGNGSAPVTANGTASNGTSKVATGTTDGFYCT